jgi:hypothetical protein
MSICLRLSRFHRCARRRGGILAARGARGRRRAGSMGTWTVGSSSRPRTGAPRKSGCPISLYRLS